MTALSCSGPAYVFEFAAALREAGIHCGLDEALSSSLAIDTLLGAAMLLADSEESAEDLRNAVTSPGGPLLLHSKYLAITICGGLSLKHSKPQKLAH